MCSDERHEPAGAEIIARQQLEPVYHRNGAAYAIARQCLLEQKVLLGQRSGAIVITEDLISIDTLEDFVAVERQLVKAPPRTDA